MKHLVFYDGTCGLCDRVVQILLKVDNKGLFAFAPLGGQTAKDILKDLTEEQKKADSLILVENFQEPNRKYYLFGKGALRICWLLGGLWSFIGWLNFLPSPPFDIFYRLIARNRHRFFSATCTLPDPKFKNRFLP